MVLVFGMTVVGCDDDPASGGGKKLTISGMTGLSGMVTVIIGEQGDNFVGGGSGTISNGSVTIALQNFTGAALSGIFSNSGSYAVILWNKAIPSGGLEELGEPEYSTTGYFSFENENTTIPWSSFSAF